MEVSAQSEMPRPKRRAYLPVKFVIEWFIALMLVLVTSPIALMLMILVKLTSRGPAIYAQTRLGKNGKLFRIYKLRTMAHNAEAASGPVWARVNDSRVTKLGAFLRRTHLDELPQLWNVLCGQMALIGPRPERPEIATRLEPHVPGWRGRLAVRPGITGLAQMILPADDPNDTTYKGVRQKVAHDVYYVREVGLRMDMRISFCTFLYFFGEAIDSLRDSVVSGHRKKVAKTFDEVETSRSERAAKANLRLAAETELVSPQQGK
jgi:lipopolysaccharide/colanic/teichoic acid biosynthesis glycosyltransferase